MNLLRAWASVVGRSKALGDLQALVVQNGGLVNAAKRLEIAPSTLRRLEKFFSSVREVGVGEGLVLYFATPLSAFDRFLVDGTIVGCLGRDTECHVAEYRKLSMRGSVARIEGGSANELEQIANALCDRVWEIEWSGASELAILGSTEVVEGLSSLAGRLDKMERWAQDLGVREYLEDKAEEHIRSKDLKCVRTWGQSALQKFAQVAQKKVLGVVLDELKPGEEE